MQLKCGETVWGDSPPRWPRLGNFIISGNSNESPLKTPLPSLFPARMTALPMSCMLRRNLQVPGEWPSCQHPVLDGKNGLVEMANGHAKAGESLLDIKQKG